MLLLSDIMTTIALAEQVKRNLPKKTVRAFRKGTSPEAASDVWTEAAKVLRSMDLESQELIASQATDETRALEVPADFPSGSSHTLDALGVIVEMISRVR